MTRHRELLPHTGVAVVFSVWRGRFVNSVLLLCFIVLWARAFYLQAIDHDFLLRKGNARSSHLVEIPAHRGRLLDRYGKVLAISTPVYSVWVSPAELHSRGVVLSTQQIQFLTHVLPSSPSLANLRQKLVGHDDFVYLARQLSPAVTQHIQDAHLPSVYVKTEPRRFYPAQDSAAQLIGFTSIDGIGQEGLELSYEDVLRAIPGVRRVVQDRHGRIIDDGQSIRLPRPGQDLSLSIDEPLQEFVYRRLKKALAETHADAASAIVVDAQNGEILAMATVPSFNPNDRFHFVADRVRNRPMTDTFEPGSVMKPFVMALALQRQVVTPSTPIVIAPGYIRIGSDMVSDPHSFHAALTATEVIQKSSNVGMAKIALQIPSVVIGHMLSQLGFGHALNLNFPGQASGFFRPAHRWRAIEKVTISYGQGISVTLLQLAHAYLVFCHDGGIMPLTLLKGPTRVVTKPVFSKKVIGQIKQMLAYVVQPGGTAPLAAVPGYQVGGKTGTAYQVWQGRYVKQYWSTFAGLAPLDHPRVVVAIVINRPRGPHYGGQIAAPIFRDITQMCLHRLNVSPNLSLLHDAERGDHHAHWPR